VAEKNKVADTCHHIWPEYNPLLFNTKLVDSRMLAQTEIFEANSTQKPYRN